MNKRGWKVPPTARLAEFPETAAEQALWWEGHILEVLHGLPPGASGEAGARPEFDPRQHSLAERERAKAAELTAAGHRVTASGIKQRRQRYQRDGLVGLADGRSAKQMPAFGKVDAAVVEAMRQAVDETAESSSKTIGFIVWRTKEILAGRKDAAGVEVPSRATLYRLYSKLATGTHATGSARTRRSVKARPPGPRLGHDAAASPRSRTEPFASRPRAHGAHPGHAGPGPWTETDLAEPHGRPRRLRVLHPAPPLRPLPVPPPLHRAMAVLTRSSQSLICSHDAE
ncbi:hypothetical protein GCM10010129_65400 [Streptomyces fumigatiscleroticus]|nr:hypothetical protein GCM10010129_65400 [Streptomyces fumigatiscleroticus]